ncbi:MAG: DUF1841 family protein [Proteobacteria bacterium]|jgi:hypothetical protein|nr:DUF1841 family protein [Pseudomonadota bacterium]MCG6936204.1 DUF1841 family protein [Pseudomonadota bacterium]
MFGQDRNQLRQLFFTAWQKHQTGAPTEPLEAQLVRIIVQHPEYHTLLEDEQTNLERDYTPELGETNPFLHMAMHLALQEQIATRRPIGITELYTELVKEISDPHEVEHRMMDCLAEMIWQSQRHGALPDEAAYLQCLRQQTKRP